MGVESWQPIETAPEGETILVCDRSGAMPYTIAKVIVSGGVAFYQGTDEEVDFSPEFWIHLGSGNPFHTPVFPETRHD